MSENNPPLIEKIRHSLAHLTAAAVLEMYPGAHNAIGPAVENGFYQDFEFPEPISDKDLRKIEKRMRRILTTWKEFEATELSKEEAIENFKHNPYKLEMVDDIHGRGEKITRYVSGNFVDLCRGGHVDSMKDINPDAFKLDRVAGAYWKGDENNKMLTRIYGLAFETKDELDDYLNMREEAKKRDHRKIGKELDLFTFSELVGPGLPLFTPKGSLMRDLIVEKIQSIQAELGYQKVTIPHITKRDLYEKSGHWDKYGDDLFKVKGAGDTEFCIKPMNCPHHTQIYASRSRSYRDLPVRYMESTMVYRDEQAGELLGLSRVRSITQDDGHVFCRPDQIKQEIKNIIHVIREFYTSLGMWNEDTYWVSLSARDPENAEKYLGDPKLWDDAEKVLAEVAEEEGLKWKKIEGEAAFYGPKLDFQFHDAIGREWQLATAQLDFNMPKRFELEYVDSDGEKKTPVMIHRAIAGSLERFMSVIIEHFAGHFPLWLAPIQAAIMPISVEKHGGYAREVYESLRSKGVRVEMHDTNDSLGKRIRNAKLQKIPYLIVLGDKEMEDKVMTVEARGDVKHEGVDVDGFMELLR